MVSRLNQIPLGRYVPDHVASAACGTPCRHLLDLNVSRRGRHPETGPSMEKSILCVPVGKYDTFARTLLSRCSQTYKACVVQSPAPAIPRASIRAVRFLARRIVLCPKSETCSSAEPCACMCLRFGSRALRLPVHIHVIADVVLQLLTVLVRDNEFIEQCAKP